MSALFLLTMFLGFVLLDIAVRRVGDRVAAARVQAERARVLETSLRLDFSEEAPTLKRIEVPSPAGRILAIDDEPIVLDSFRKILVLAGYSVDTVESGPEALGLVRRRDYDFVFTDLKMPEMDGGEIVRAMHHLRPDIDVAVITGYGGIDTAVDTLKHGAVDYVQKPFTEDELIAFTRRLAIRRQARIESERKPAVKVVSLTAADGAPAHEYSVPGGAFLAPWHTWIRIEPDGTVRVGIDDFLRKALVRVDAIELPAVGAGLAQRDSLAVLRRAGETLSLPTPISGQLSSLNTVLLQEPSLLLTSPYADGWIAVLRPTDLAGELAALRIGLAVIPWYQDEIARLREKQSSLGTRPLEWAWLADSFLKATAAPRR